MSKKITLIVLAFFASIFLVACGKSPDVTANANGTKIGDTIKIGVNMELTGAVAAYGKAEQNGIKLAVDEINKAGGVDGKKLELVTKDNKSENAEASTSSTNLAIQSNVNAIVGPATSGAVAAASLVSQKTGVPLLTPSGTQDDLTVDTNGAKKFVFRTTFKDSYQGKVLAAYSYSNLNAKKENLDIAGMMNVLNKKSGLLGLSGGLSSDFRDLNDAAQSGNEDAANAIDVLCYGIAKFVGGYVAAMNGVDAIVFTAGIGENAIPVREKVVSYLGYLGVTLDKEANGVRGEEIVISTPDSKVKVAVIPTNEELAICRETVALV